ncbi:DUF6233 domain-containing protein [Streptomyces sp. PTD9-10]|uniref:DUF6233 domain-containing protein n=1 Tax=Streptomyces sp. PTD9-10 TaxID=3120151 RepID=UPI00300B8DCA
MSQLPPDPPRLRAVLAYLDSRVADHETVGIYLRLQRDAVRSALAAAERQAPGRQQLPPTQRSALGAPTQQQASGYKVEQKLSKGHPLGAAVHLADCTMTQRGTRPVSADDARKVLSQDPQFFRACEFCRPDTKLGIVD